MRRAYPPRLIGSSMLGMSDFDFETYTNPEVIAVGQDKLGLQGMLVWSDCPSKIPPMQKTTPPCGHAWAKWLSGGRLALVLVNYATNDRLVTCDPMCMAAACGGGKDCAGMRYLVRDVWARQDIPSTEDSVGAIMVGGSAQMYVLTPVGPGRISVSVS